MIDFPCAKINLGLNIIGRRADGYHDIETVFYPIGLTDALEVVPSSDEMGKNGSDDGKTSLHRRGISIDAPADSDLTVKAYRLLDADYHLPPVDIHLLKKIPMGAGLGGGSSDAASALCLLNNLFALGLSTEELEAYAARLGADCAFFVNAQPVFAEGIGNILTPIGLSLNGYGIIVVKPDVFVSTKEAYAGVKPRRPQVSLRRIIGRPVETWRENMTNDFEESIFARYPVIGDVKNELYRLGAVYASMSGSGSSVYGLFAPGRECPTQNFAGSAFVYKGRLK